MWVYGAGMPANPTFDVATFYRFTRFDDPDAVRTRLLTACERHGVRGTIILAHEGINGTIAARSAGMGEMLSVLRGLPGCVDLSYRMSQSEDMPFWRMKVKVKPEIVTMGVTDIDAQRHAGTYVAPEDWNDLISDPDVVVIDTRNDYEVEAGTFRGAVDPKTVSFRDFPAWFAGQGPFRPDQKIAMFCTGGIRCEKATAFVKQQGAGQVFHLKGGILNYLETVPEEQSLWRGECFVFDQRVTVGHGLAQGTYGMCHACRRPLSRQDMRSDFFIEGVSCPKCHNSYVEQDRTRFAERQKQVELAEARGTRHIGAKLCERTETERSGDG